MKDKLPTWIVEGFYHWWFEHFGDTESCQQWNILDDQSEYGYSCVEFMWEYPEYVILDAKLYFEKHPDEFDNLFINYRNSLVDKIAQTNALLLEIGKHL